MQKPRIGSGAWFLFLPLDSPPSADRSGHFKNIARIAMFLKWWAG